MERRAKFYGVNGNLLYKADNCLSVKNAAICGEIELITLARDSYPGRRLGKHELSGVKSIGYWNIKKLVEWGLEWHTNEGIEICFLESGNLSFHLENAKYELVPNHLTITRPWIPHKLGEPAIELGKLHWLILDVEVRHPHQDWVWPNWIILNKTDLSKLTLYLRQNEQPVWKATSEIRECFIRIGKVIKDTTLQSCESQLRILINALLMALLGHFQNDNVPLNEELIKSRRTVKLFLNTLEERFHEQWTLADMAAYCQLGTTRFSNYCKEISNCTPMEYLNRIRLRNAANLLIHEHTSSVIDVAYKCGFSSSQYFTTVFKAYFMKTPQVFRTEKKIISP